MNVSVTYQVPSLRMYQLLNLNHVRLVVVVGGGGGDDEEVVGRVFCHPSSLPPLQLKPSCSSL